MTEQRTVAAFLVTSPRARRTASQALCKCSELASVVLVWALLCSIYASAPLSTTIPSPGSTWGLDLLFIFYAARFHRSLSQPSDSTISFSISSFFFSCPPPEQPSFDSGIHGTRWMRFPALLCAGSFAYERLCCQSLAGANLSFRARNASISLIDHILSFLILPLAVSSHTFNVFGPTRPHAWCSTLSDRLVLEFVDVDPLWNIWQYIYRVWLGTNLIN